MKFTTPCFVRVEDAEKRYTLQEWCIRLGYKQRLPPFVTANNEDLSCIVVHNDDVFSLQPAGTELLERYSSGIYDCGTDIELFKALAAMNDENDYHQVFVHKECGFTTINDDTNRCFLFLSRDLFRKATAEERMREKAIKAYCADCCYTVIGKCAIKAENCIALQDFIKILNEQ